MIGSGSRGVPAAQREILAALTSALGGGRVQAGVALAPMTTFRTGGPADWYFETSSAHEVAAAVAVSDRLGLPVTFLGGGSNVLVGDGGVRGLVVRLRHGRISMPQSGVVRADAGVSMNGLVRWTVSHGLAGIERWAGTPGTVGGAVYGNAHFGGRSIGDQVVSVEVAQRTGRATVAGADMRFGYDRSRLQSSGEVALWADFAVTTGVVPNLRAAARASLAYRKRTQPLSRPSAGCIFKNPDPRTDALPVGIPASAGALIDRAGLKGAVVGGASVSRVHANFIVSDGRATSAEIRELIAWCRDRIYVQFGVRLHDEIVQLGEF